MKHILNDLTEQEKNAIREQHTGGMKVMTENFSKLINSKLGDSKPLVAEQNKFEVDPKDLEMPELPDEETLKKFEKVVPDFKNAMKACVAENNLYKVKSFIDGVETKKMNMFNTIMANLFDRKAGGKSLNQEFNEFTKCINQKIGGKLSGMMPKTGMNEQVSNPFKIGQVIKAIRDKDQKPYTIKIVNVGDYYVVAKITGSGTYKEGNMDQPLDGKVSYELTSNQSGQLSGNGNMGIFKITQ